MAEKPTLSLCMITKNEEMYLKQCLDPVKNIVDEIILVDTGSTDKTLEIAEQFGAKILHFNWIDDFSAARNESLGQARGDWILVLDADETISEQDCEKIRRLMDLHKASEIPIGFFMHQRDYLNNHNVSGFIASKDDGYKESQQYAGWKEKSIVRLFSNTNDIKFKGRLHETIDGSITRLGGKLIDSKIPIHHYGKVRPKEQMETKKELYLKIGAKKLEENKEDPRALFEHAKRMMQEDPKQAIELFEKAKAIKGDSTLPLLDSLIIDCCAMLRDIEKAKAIFEKAAPSPDLYTSMAIAYSNTKERAEAESLFEKALDLDPKNMIALKALGNIHFKKAAMRDLTQLSKARQYFQKITLINPKAKGVYEMLGKIALLYRDNELARTFLIKEIKVNPTNTDALFNLAMIDNSLPLFKKAREVAIKNKENQGKIAIIDKRIKMLEDSN